MTRSRQPQGMRDRHMDNALVELREAAKHLGNARDWVFDLDHAPGMRSEIARAKTAVERAIVTVSRQSRSEHDA